MKKQNKRKVAVIDDVVKQIGEFAAVTDKKFDHVMKQIDGLAVATDKKFDYVMEQIEELAVVTSKGFDRVDKRFEEVDKRFEAIDRRFVEIERRLDKIWLEVGTMRRDIYDIKTEMIKREEFEQLIARVEFLEKKLKVRV